TWLAVEPNVFHPYIFWSQSRLRRAGFDEDHFRPWRAEPVLRKAGFEVTERRYAFFFPGWIDRVPGTVAWLEPLLERFRLFGDQSGATAFARATFRIGLAATAPLVLVALALAAPLSHLLHIHSVGIVVLAESTLVTALVFPVTLGVLQGLQRFHALAATYVFPLLVRLVFFAGLASAGYRLGGAIAATLVGAVAGTALSIALMREPLGGGTEIARPELRSFFTYLGPVAVGLVGIALLTHVDILIVKARFSGGEAGAYGAASAFARVAFFLPATILAVLFPRTAARQARGEETEDILGRSLLATAAFCGLLALFYAAAGEGLVSTTFGSGFAAGVRVLAPFALAIGLYSPANVLVRYHLV